MRALIIIDMQIDLVRDGGALSKNAEGELYGQPILQPTIDKIKEFKKYDLPIITTAMILKKDSLAVKQLGEFCLEGSDGAKITSQIWQELHSYTQVSVIYHRGYNVLSDGWLLDTSTPIAPSVGHMTSNEARRANWGEGQARPAPKTFEAILKGKNITSVDIAGLPLSTTVTDTAIAFRERGIPVNIIKNAVADFNKSAGDFYLRRLQRFYGVNIDG